MRNETKPFANSEVVREIKDVVQKARAKLMDVVRSSDDAELRGETIFWLAQTGGDQTVAFLSQLYDSEKTTEVKKKIIFSLTPNHVTARPFLSWVMSSVGFSIVKAVNGCPTATTEPST